MATQTLPTADPTPDVPARERTAAKERTRWERFHGRLPRFRFIRRVVDKVIDDDVTDLGAMMAYYAVLALFPMLVFVVTIALLVIDAETVHQGVLIATRTLPEGARQMISEQVTAFINAADAGFAIGSFVFALWGASRGAASLGGALGRICGCTETRPWWRRQLLAIAITISVALMMVLAMALLVVGPAIGHYVADRFGLGAAFDLVWSLGRWVGAALLVMIVWGVLYHFLPNTNTPFRIFTTGSFVGIAMWIVISLGFNFYLTNFGSYESTYGTLGGAIAFLTWLWLSNIALLVGAEVNHVLSKMRAEKAEAWLAVETVRSLDTDENLATDR